MKKDYAVLKKSVVVLFIILLLTMNQVICFSASPPSVSGPGNPPTPPGSGSGKVHRAGRLFPMSMLKHYKHTKRVLPQSQTGSSFQFEHSIDGNWDLVVGEIGFFMETAELGEAFISIIGIEAVQGTGNTYKTVPWDRRVFWVDVGDGVPMHVAAELYGFEETPDGNFNLVYYNYSILYREQGKDYSNTELNGEEINLVLITDEENNVLDYEIERTDENGEFLDQTKFNVGDQIETWTTVFDLDDPETIWLTTMEEDYRTITQEPRLFYQHLTPNVDFVNETSKGQTDFSAIQLQLALFGIREDFDTGDAEYRFSSVKDLGITWDDVSSSVMDWKLLQEQN